MPIDRAIVLTWFSQNIPVSVFKWLWMDSFIIHSQYWIFGARKIPAILKNKCLIHFFSWFVAYSLKHKNFLPFQAQEAMEQRMAEILRQISNLQDRGKTLITTSTSYDSGLATSTEPLSELLTTSQEVTAKSETGQLHRLEQQIQDMTQQRLEHLERLQERQTAVQVGRGKCCWSVGPIKNFESHFSCEGNLILLVSI